MIFSNFVTYLGKVPHYFLIAAGLVGTLSVMYCIFA